MISSLQMLALPSWKIHLCSTAIRDGCRATAEPLIRGSWRESTWDSSLLGCEDLREGRRVICPFLSQGTSWRQETMKLNTEPIQIQEKILS